MSKGFQEKIVFPEIYSLSYKPKSGCEFFEAIERNGSYFAKCKILDSFITRSKVSKCENLWMDCPYRRLGLKHLSGTRSYSA
ncbi:MAG: hypothetical protein G5Z42_05710 [Caldisphaeraceae archaeon]|nr:hypothetical protein [Caldisphaeraceae archaeon]MEB3692283.1 hypothetical protein [Caldisphaeraceae archaeon]MEB3798294.1 hypothetical protein [Caldisphaeraceae archaeon]